jgi:biopolymer transport protein ExbB
VGDHDRQGPHFGATARQCAFMLPEAAGAPLDHLAATASCRREADSSLWRMYAVAIDEMQPPPSARLRPERRVDATIGAIRASMDGVMVRESERMAGA